MSNTQDIDSGRRLGYYIYHGRFSNVKGGAPQRLKFRFTASKRDRRAVLKRGENVLANTSAVDDQFDDYEYYDAMPESGPLNEPEVDLWVACLGQQIEDATIPDEIVNRPWRGGGENPAILRARARAYIFAPVGSTAQDFKEVCLLANFEPDFIRECVQRMIDEGKTVSREKITQALKGVDEADKDE